MVALHGIRMFLQGLGRFLMWRKLTEYILAVCDLLEAEGRMAWQAIRRAVFGILILLVAGLLLATGVGFLIAALYLALALAVHAWAAALITGGIVLGIGSLVAWIGVQAWR